MSRTSGRDSVVSGVRLVAGALFLSMIGLACSSDGGGTGPAPEPSALLKFSGDAQTGSAGQALTNPIVVRVNDQQGNPFSGAGVSFSVTQGGGSLSSATATTGSDGRASVTWAVGTQAGTTQQVRAQITSSSIAAVTFSATVVAGPADSIALFSGDGQQGGQGGALAQPLVVRVSDAFGNPVAGRAVSWAATVGGGSVNPAADTSGANGQAQTVWTLGPVGPQVAEATASGLIGSPVTFAATAIVLSLATVTPDTLVEGQAATLTGDGFDPTPANNTVTVGGLAATVTSASTTSLDIIVPSYDCEPARDVGVDVTVGGSTSNAVTRRVHPASFVGLSVGEQLIVHDPTSFCFQFRPSAAGGDAYVVGVGAAAETPGSVMGISLVATAGAPTAAVAATPPPPQQAAAEGSAVQLDEEWLTTKTRQARLERAIRNAEREVFARARAGTAALAAPIIAQQVAAAVPNVGDTLHLRILADGNDVCDGGFTEIDAVVRNVGQAGVWATDVSLPTIDSLTDADIAAFSAEFDNNIYPVDTLYFGVPSDRDNNQRVIIVLSEQVNALGFAGFVSPGDLFVRTSCAASNEGEYFYGRVPDPTGSVGPAASKSSVVNFMPSLIAHEFAHNIQTSRRLFAPGVPTLQSRWEAEGQATMAEEVVGHSVLGNLVGQDYGRAVVNQGAGILWYQQAFLQVGLYFGWTPPSGKVPNAPEQCTLFQYDPSPCNDFDFYGASFIFHRFISDRFGSSYPGGETQLHRDLIGANTTLAGRANVEAVVGVDFDSLFAQWGAMLYVDGRVTGAAPEIDLSSWDLFDIMSSYSANLQLLIPQRPFSAFSDVRTVRSGSTAYTRIGGSGARAALAIRARTSTGGFLSAGFAPQFWIVRVQ